tara:strand:+ start:241 stop:717 length:477 start_codon:yes stop_codon:yes gene_type:complete
MKLTKTKLKQIIKEELGKVLNELSPDLQRDLVAASPEIAGKSWVDDFRKAAADVEKRLELLKDASVTCEMLAAVRPSDLDAIAGAKGFSSVVQKAFNAKWTSLPKRCAGIVLPFEDYILKQVTAEEERKAKERAEDAAGERSRQNRQAMDAYPLEAWE